MKQLLISLSISIILPFILSGQSGNVGIGTNNPQARMQINHKSTTSRPSFAILDSINGLGASMRFQRVGLDSFFTFSAGFDGPEAKRGMILSWIDDSLLWVKSDGRLGLGTGNPQARMQVNHKSTAGRPSIAILDSINGLGPSMRFQRVGLESFFTFSSGFDGPETKRGMILSWIDDSLLWVKSDGRLGLGTGNPMAKMQVNHKSTAGRPSIAILDSINGLGPSMRFQREGLESFFTFSSGFDGPETKRGMILSWIDDSLLWVKSDGRLGLGTGNPLAKMQVNHRSTPQSPTFLMLDSLSGGGPSMRFQRLGLDSFFTFSAGFDGPASKRGMILSWIDDSLLWVKSDGRLGLGTGNPLAKMQVNHRSTALEPAIRILDSANSGFSGIAFNRTGELQEFGIGSHKPGGGATGVGIRSNADFPFFLTQGGNLGLGTTNPTQRLDVQGNTNISGQLLFNGQAGQAGQVLKSNGALDPPTWADPGPIDAFSFKAFSSNILVSGGSTGTVNSTTEKYDIGNIHNPSTGITTISKAGTYLVTIRGGFTTNSTETGSFLLRVILEVLNNDNSVAESVEETAALPGGLGAHTSNVSLHTQLQLQTGQKLRVKLSNTRPAGGVNSRLDEFSAVLL